MYLPLQQYQKLHIFKGFIESELLIDDPKRGVIGEFVQLNNNFFQVGKDFPPSRSRNHEIWDNQCLQVVGPVK